MMTTLQGSTAPALTYLNARLAIFYFSYLAALGAFSPYFGPFLSARGFSDTQVGLVMALWYGTRIFAPSLWNAAIAKAARPSVWLQGGAGVVLLSAALFQPHWPLFAVVLVMLVFASFYNAIMPQFEAHTLHVLAATPGVYGRVRLFGSLGFLLVVLGYGALFNRIGVEYLILAMLPILLLLWLSTCVQGALVLDRPQANGSNLSFWQRCMGLPPIAYGLLGVAFLNQIAHGPFYVYFSLYLGRAEYSKLSIGALWSLGVVAEILMFFWLSSRYAKRIPGFATPEKLLALSMFVGALRWCLVALFPEHIVVLCLSQCLHAFTFAAAHSCLMQLITRHFSHELGFAQSLFYGFSGGVGGVQGAGLAALLWAQRSPSAASFGAAAVSFAAFLLCLRIFAAHSASAIR